MSDGDLDGGRFAQRQDAREAIQNHIHNLGSQGGNSIDILNSGAIFCAHLWVIFCADSIDIEAVQTSRIILGQFFGRVFHPIELSPSGESRISADAKAERMTTTTNGAARRSEGSKQEASE